MFDYGKSLMFEQFASEVRGRKMLSILALFALIGFGVCDDPIVTVPNGQVKGLAVTSLRNQVPFYAYMGIPFAAPPVGSLRFMPPQAPSNWDGVLDATANTRSCYQITTHTIHGQTEDCLYLNVYTPASPTETDAGLPVLVTIYGGSFTHGSAAGDVYGPQSFIEQGIIVVSFNYRVGPFGFLSTTDDVIAGNMGLKDQRLALQWVQENIKVFGGDPTKVTIHGQSAGAASVTFQILSPSSAGLFRAAISNSGSALCPWARDRKAKATAYGVAQLIDSTFTTDKSSQELLEFLQSVDADAIHDTQSRFMAFAPVIEPEHDGAMITEPMYQSLLNGNINKVPLIIGFNSEEELSKAADLDSWKTKMTTYDNNVGALVNADMNLENSPSAIALEVMKKQVGTTIRNIYTDGLLADSLGAGIQWMSDDMFTRGNLRYGQVQANYTPVYVYEFSYHGDMGGNSVSYPGIGQVLHGEDGKYLWGKNVDMSTYPEADVTTFDRYVGIHANFVKYLNPTPEQSELFQNLIWPTVTTDTYNYLNIDTDLTVATDPRGAVYKKWVVLFDKYQQAPLETF